MQIVLGRSQQLMRRTLCIDAMGTLVRLRPPAPRLVAQLATRCEVTVTEAQASTALRAEIAYYREHMQTGRDAESVAALRTRCAAVLRRALPADPRLAAVEDGLMTDVLLDALRFEPFPDARDALLRARRAGARVVVVSNWDVSLIEVLEEVGLAPLIDGVVTSAAVGARKPDPAIFAHALALAGAPAHDAVHVGDSPTEDVAGARAAAITAVLVDRGDRQRGGARTDVPVAVRVIGDLDELVWADGVGGGLISGPR